MDAAFERVLQISFSGSIIVLAVLALRLILRRAPKRTVCLLWMIAVLRLLVPFEIQSDWSLQPEPVTFAPTVQLEGTFEAAPPVELIPDAEPEDEVFDPVPEIPEESTEPVDILPWLWAAGVGLLALHGAVSYVRLKRRVREAVILEEGVWVCPGLDTAFVLGFFRPRVYLPVLPREDRELVLLHERQHIRRLDHWWKLLAYAAVSLHWFNPLAWVTYILMCRDMELACDQETVKGMDNARRKAYSAALLRCAVKRSGIAACPVAFGEISVKERIKMVLNYKKPGFWLTVIALAAAIAVGAFLLTSPKELTDLERCEQGLKQWQEMDVYQFHQSQSNVGEMALNEWSVIDFWSSGGDHLMLFKYADEQGWWQHWKDGKGYSRDTESLDAEREAAGWREAEFRETEVLPWFMRLDWEALTIHHWEAADDGNTVLLTVDFPTLGAGVLSFYFDDDGELRSVTRSYTDRNSTVITGTIELVETERVKIEQEMEHFGVAPELVQLHRELEKLQAMENVHLFIDMEYDSEYPGADSGWEEFIRSGENYYWNAESQSPTGTITDSFLKYDGTPYAREYSKDGLVPSRGWEEISDRGFEDMPLLTRDWSQYPMLEIEKAQDGSAIILLQGDLTDTDQYTTYYSKIYEFHLDPEGKLTTYINNYHSRKIVSDSFAQGVFEFRGKDTVRILDTPKEELERRILEVAKEVKEVQSAAQKRGA